MHPTTNHSVADCILGPDFLAHIRNHRHFVHHHLDHHHHLVHHLDYNVDWL
jgi:hypothetical protein